MPQYLLVLVLRKYLNYSNFQLANVQNNYMISIFCTFDVETMIYRP